MVGFSHTTIYEKQHQKLLKPAVKKQFQTSSLDESLESCMKSQINGLMDATALR